MKRRKVKDSSLLFSVGWENAVLEVRYTDAMQKVFRYYGVPESVYEKIFTEDSPGGYFLSVRDNYNHRQVGG